MSHGFIRTPCTMAWMGVMTTYRSNTHSSVKSESHMTVTGCGDDCFLLYPTERGRGREMTGGTSLALWMELMKQTSRHSPGCEMPVWKRQLRGHLVFSSKKNITCSSLSRRRSQSDRRRLHWRKDTALHLHLELKGTGTPRETSGWHCRVIPS